MVREHFFLLLWDKKLKQRAEHKYLLSIPYASGTVLSSKQTLVDRSDSLSHRDTFYWHTQVISALIPTSQPTLTHTEAGMILWLVYEASFTVNIPIKVPHHSSILCLNPLATGNGTVWKTLKRSDMLNKGGGWSEHITQCLNLGGCEQWEQENDFRKVISLAVKSRRDIWIHTQRREWIETI